MAIPEEFWEKLPDRSDLELYEMLVQNDVYLPEAVEAGRQELCRRGKLTPEGIAELEAAAAQARALAKEIEAHEAKKRHLAGAIGHIFGFMGH